MYISIEQALDVYEELIDAMNGVNSFGGEEASIYAYRLMPNSPTYSMYNENKLWDEENRLLEKKAAEDFHSLCHIFAKKHEASINICGIDMHEWIAKIRSGELRFFDRIQVKVTNPSK